VSSEFLVEVFQHSAALSHHCTGVDVLTLLNIKTFGVAFCKSYAAALGVDILNIEDGDMIKRLAKILEQSSFTKIHIIHILKSSCEHADSYKRAGQFLFSFCTCLSNEEDAYDIMVQGEIVTSYTFLCASTLYLV
jgi:hypothetical protein